MFRRVTQRRESSGRLRYPSSERVGRVGRIPAVCSGYHLPGYSPTSPGSDRLTIRAPGSNRTGSANPSPQCLRGHAEPRLPTGELCGPGRNLLCVELRRRTNHPEEAPQQREAGEAQDALCDTSQHAGKELVAEYTDGYKGSRGGRCEHERAPPRRQQSRRASRQERRQLHQQIGRCTSDGGLTQAARTIDGSAVNSAAPQAPAAISTAASQLAA